VKNQSKKSFKQLAAIFAENLTEAIQGGEEAVIAEAFWEQGIRLVGLFPLALCASDYESLPEPLNDWVEMGDFDRTFPGAHVDGKFLSKQRGVLVVFEAQIMNFDRTAFGKNGRMDSCSGSGWGYTQTSFVWVKTVAEVNKAIATEYVEAVAEWIAGAAEK
jgi:hypothetical protein